MEVHSQKRVHRCLLIPEIFDQICVQLDQTLSNRKKKSSLAALAQTCRLFRETPLDLLWSKLPDLVLLIRCMPSDLWAIDEHKVLVCHKAQSYLRRLP